MHLAKLPNGYAEIKDDGTWTLHPVHFDDRDGDIIKITYDPQTGRPVKKEFYEPRDHLFTVDSDGRVLQVERGFLVGHELIPPVHPDPDKRYVQLRASEIPADFRREVDGFLVCGYRWGNGKFVARTAADIEAEIAPQREARAERAKAMAESGS